MALASLVEKTLAASRLVADDVDRLLDDAADPSGLVALTRDSLRAFVESVVTGVTSDADEAPAVHRGAERHGVSWAAEGYSLEALLGLYGMAHRLAMHRAVSAIERNAQDPQRVQRLLARGAEVGSQMHVAVTDALVTGFVQVADRDRRAAGNWKLRLVRRLLGGEPVEETPLGYPLRGYHVAVVVAGSDAESTASVVQDSWPGRTLRICADSQTLWLWLAAVSLDRSLLPRAGLALSPDTALAIGDPGAGREGFVESHRQALIALRLGTREGRGVAYEDVALVALLAQDQGRARQFVVRELGQLNAEGSDAERLRATVRTYLDCQCNVASTAALMRVHENTVKHRLDQITAKLGRSVRSRATELDVALRLRELDAGAWAAVAQSGPPRDPSL